VQLCGQCFDRERFESIARDEFRGGRGNAVHATNLVFHNLGLLAADALVEAVSA
jgi:hypothetical protein